MVGYTNDKETKAFLESEAQKVKLTYGDLVKHYVRLNQTVGSFAQIPVGGYINFLSDFLGAEPGATREQAIKAWKTLKTLDVPKTYREWKKCQ